MSSSRFLRRSKDSSIEWDLWGDETSLEVDLEGILNILENEWNVFLRLLIRLILEAFCLGCGEGGVVFIIDFRFCIEEGGFFCASELTVGFFCSFIVWEVVLTVGADKSDDMSGVGCDFLEEFELDWAGKSCLMDVKWGFFWGGVFAGEGGCKKISPIWLLAENHVCFGNVVCIFEYSD